MFWQRDPNKKYIKIANQLDKTGKGFCLAKWHMVTIHLHTGDNHSCYHPSMHRVSVEEIKENPAALHNSKYKKQQRKAMLEGERPPECSYCWALEDVNQISDRHLRSWEFENARPSITTVTNLPWDADVYPRYMELSFGSECQMKCMYCAPTISSAWEAEIKKHGEYPLEYMPNRRQYAINPKGRPVYKEEDNPYIDAFWKWFPECYKNLETLRVTGGEPLLSSNFVKMLDYIEANPRPDLQFAINSNMSVPQRNLDKFIERAKSLKENNKVKEIVLYTSVDTWGDQAEYIRNGLDLERWEYNVHRYLKEVPDGKLGLMITVNFLSIFNFEKLLDKILELRKMYNTRFNNRIQVDTPYLLEPPHLSLQIANDAHIARLYSAIEYMKTHVNNLDFRKFNSTEFSKFERVAKWAEDNRYSDDRLLMIRRDFVAFINEHDKRRGTSFLTTFPEIATTVAEWNTSDLQSR
jgi:organic radical activating enzyme